LLTAVVFCHEQKNFEWRTSVGIFSRVDPDSLADNRCALGRTIFDASFVFYRLASAAVYKAH